MTVTIPIDPDTIEGQLRELLGDDTLGQGLLPDGAHFQDEQLLRFYAAEGDHLGRAAAHAFEVLTRKWAVVPIHQQLGPESESLAAVQRFHAEALRLRRLHGYPPGHAPWQRPMGDAPITVQLP